MQEVVGVHVRDQHGERDGQCGADTAPCGRRQRTRQGRAAPTQVRRSHQQVSVETWVGFKAKYRNTDRVQIKELGHG